MPFVRNSLSTIVDNIISDFQTRITGATSLMRRSVLRVIARVMAGAIHLVYEYLDYQSRQLFALTADQAGLETIASEYGLSREAAIQATGSGTATGTVGSIIPAGSQLQSVEGEIYSIDTAVTFTGSSATVDFTAVEGGTDGNEAAGTILSFVSPIVGVNTSVTVDSDGITGGEDEETDDELRTRLLARKRMPPHGGASFDYESWALEYSGVTRAWCFPQYAGVGTVGVAFVRDDDVGSIVPNAAERAAVRAYIVSHEDPATGLTVGCPVTAEPGLTMVELTELAVDMTIKVYPNTSAVQNAIEQELESLFIEDGGPGETIYLSKISQAISSAQDEEMHSLVSPIADITASTSEVQVLGTITFADY